MSFLWFCIWTVDFKPFGEVCGCCKSIVENGTWWVGLASDQNSSAFAKKSGNLQMGGQFIVHSSPLSFVEGMQCYLLTFLIQTAIYTWLVCGYVRIKEQTPLIHMLKRNWTTSLNFINHSTLNSEHNLEDLCIQVRNQKTCTSNNNN